MFDCAQELDQVQGGHRWTLLGAAVEIEHRQHEQKDPGWAHRLEQGTQRREPRVADGARSGGSGRGRGAGRILGGGVLLEGVAALASAGRFIGLEAKSTHRGGWNFWTLRSRLY